MSLKSAMLAAFATAIISAASLTPSALAQVGVTIEQLDPDLRSSGESNESEIAGRIDAPNAALQQDGLQATTLRRILRADTMRIVLIGTLAQSQTPVGVWLHANKRIRVEIFPCGEQLCGKTVWFRKPNDAQGTPLVDLKNRNAKLRKRPLLRLTVLRGLRRSSANLWTGGKIYNPDDGVDYQAQMSIHNGTLRVRAYVVMPELGQTLIWTRVR